MERLLNSIKSGRTYPCPRGTGGGFSDMSVGTQVTVEDGHGSTMATSSLSGGVLGIHGCTFVFSVEVADADFYRVTVAQRGALTYSRVELDRAGWKVSAHL